MWEKIDRVTEIGQTDEPIETSEFPVYKPNCNLTTCRYNEDGKCENEEKRKECVEVSRKVLCLEKNFIGVIENTGQEIYGTVTKHYLEDAAKEFVRTFDVTRNIIDFGITSKLRLVAGEVIEVYKSDNCQRLIEY